MQAGRPKCEALSPCERGGGLDQVVAMGLDRSRGTQGVSWRSSGPHWAVGLLQKPRIKGFGFSSCIDRWWCLTLT